MKTSNKVALAFCAASVLVAAAFLVVMALV
jgi:hypothetical protein